jgi:hypothetical protein
LQWFPFIRRLAKRLRPRNRYSAFLVAVFAALSVVYVTMDTPPVFTASPWVHGDGTYYFVYLRSLVYDGDLDFANDYAILGNHSGMPRNPKTGHWESVMPIGVAVLQLPLGLVARATVSLARWLGLSNEPANGAGILFQKITQFSSVVWGFLAVVLGFRLAAGIVPRRPALLGAMGTLLATPLLWYMLRQPCYSHATDAFVSAVFIYYWWKTEGTTTRRRWFILGLAIGLATLVRPQNVVYGLMAFAEWVGLTVHALREKDALGWRRLGFFLGLGACLVGGLLLAFSPQMYAWWYMFGTPLTMPQGSGFMLWGASRPWAALFSTRYGFFAWHPLAYLGSLGLLWPVLRRGTDPRLRRMLVICIVAYLVQAYVNGAVADWWGHWAFGGRRFVGQSIFCCLGLAIALHALGGWLQRHAVLLLKAAPTVLVVIFGLLNLSLMDDYLFSRARHEYPQPMKPIWKSAVNKAIDSVYGVTGNWGSIPDNWRFAIKAGVSPERYDEAAASDIDAPLYAPVTLSLTSDVHAMAGFGDPTRYKDRPCRWIQGTHGSWVFSSRESLALDGTVELAAAREHTRVRMRVGGHTILDADIGSDWTTRPFALPRELVSAGVVFVNVEQELPAVAPVPVGQTGRFLRYQVSVESAGYLVGNRASIRLADQATPITERGLTLVVLDQRAPKARATSSFDTFADPAAPQRLKEAVDKLPADTVVVLLAKDDAASQWRQAHDGIIRQLGGQASLVGHYRASYALIGSKGAAPGQAMEALSDSAAVSLAVGRSPADQARGVAYGTVTLVAKRAAPAAAK